MQEDNVDISKHTSNHIDEYKDVLFDYVITVCDNAKESCPLFPGNAQKFHHNFPDPAKADGTHVEIMDSFREVRDMIKEFSSEFVNRHL